MNRFATLEERDEQFRRETLPSCALTQPYYHPGGCANCGDEPCYMLCFNHPAYYSAEQEREDTLYEDSLPHDTWFRMAISQYERVHGTPYVS